MTAKAEAMESIPAAGVKVQMIPVWLQWLWSVRREMWENKALIYAPAAMCALSWVGLVVAILKAHQVVGGNVTDVRDGLMQLLGVAAVVIMVTTGIVAVFYCLDALHSERRDRSVLFWKSLPVGDGTVVLSKAGVAALLLPSITLVVTVITHIGLLAILSVSGGVTGLGWWDVWANAALGQVWLQLAYHLLAIQVLWYAPIYAYLLLVSAAAPRAPILWAVLPPLALSIVEKIAWNTAYLGGLIRERFSGPFGDHWQAGPMHGTRVILPGVMGSVPAAEFFASPGLWIGLVVAAVLLFGATRVRRYRGPM